MPEASSFLVIILEPLPLCFYSFRFRRLSKLFSSLLVIQRLTTSCNANLIRDLAVFTCRYSRNRVLV